MVGIGSRETGKIQGLWRLWDSISDEEARGLIYKRILWILGVEHVD